MPPHLVHELDDYDLSDFAAVAARYGQSTFGYVVTPNVDHLIRWLDEESFRELYADAAYVLLDSRLLARILRLTKGISARVCTGSDLTAQLIQKIAQPTDTVVLIGGSEAQANILIERYGLKGLRHFNPPMGFIRSPQAVEECLAFIEAHSPFRFCLLAVGCPQQEMLAQMLKRRGVARGLALCIGASINFLTGVEQRAPRWMQKLSLEWLYRLLQDPGRLARRYLIRGPRIFALLGRFDVIIRRRS